MLKNPPFCCFALFLIVSLTPFIKSSDSSRDLTIFMTSSISPIELINVVVPELYIFFWMAESVANATAVNPNGIKTLVANDLSTLFNKDNPVISNGQKGLPRNPHVCTTLDSSIFDKLFAMSYSRKLYKALKLVYQLVIIYVEN